MKTKTRIPRKLKKQIRKIPVGYYCYGSTFGAKPKTVNGKKKWITVSCPFHHDTFCSLMKVVDFLCLPDSTKICGIYDEKDAFTIRNRKHRQRLVMEDGRIMRFIKGNGMEILNEENKWVKQDE